MLIIIVCLIVLLTWILAGIYTILSSIGNKYNKEPRWKWILVAPVLGIILLFVWIQDGKE